MLMFCEQFSSDSDVHPTTHRSAAANVRYLCFMAKCVLCKVSIILYLCKVMEETCGNKRGKLRVAVITSVFAVLSLVHLCYGLNAGGTLAAVTKGLPIAFLLLCAIIWGRKHPCAGFALFFSLLGDEAGRISSQHSFELMVLFFAVAHVFYIRDFLRYIPRSRFHEQDLYSLVPFLCGGYAVFLISNLVFCCLQKREGKALFVAGSVLFLISDSLILLRMILGGFPHSGLWVMSTYYLAQYFLNVRVIYEKQLVEY